MRTKRKEVRLKNSATVKFLMPKGDDKRERPKMKIAAHTCTVTQARDLQKKVNKFLEVAPRK